MQELIDFVKNNVLIQILIVGAIIYYFIQYNKETLDNISGINSITQAIQPVVEMAPVTSPVVDEQSAYVDNIVAGSSQLTTSDLLPVYDDANDFSKQNPVSKLLASQNYLQAGFHSGVNTVIQSNGIPYLDLRSCPPIPKQEVGPWQQSSYEQSAGAQRRFLEIG